MNSEYEYLLYDYELDDSQQVNWLIADNCDKIC